VFDLMKNKILLLLIMLSFFGVAFALSVMPDDNSLVDNTNQNIDQNKQVEPVISQDNTTQQGFDLVNNIPIIVGGAILLILIILGVFFVIKNKKVQP